jgi:hypothetical protein
MSEDLRRGAARGSHSPPETEFAAVSNVTDDTGEYVERERPKAPPRRKRAASCYSMSSDGKRRQPHLFLSDLVSCRPKKIRFRRAY